MAAVKADHLAGDAGVTPVSMRQPRADRHGVDRPRHLHHQPAHAGDAAVDLDAVEIGDLLGERFHHGRARVAREAYPFPLVGEG